MPLTPLAPESPRSCAKLLLDLMEDSRKLTVQFTPKPSDIYDPFFWSWRNLARWVATLCACVLIYDRGPSWSVDLFEAEIKPALLTSILIGFALVVIFLLPWLAVQSQFRKSPAARRSRCYSFSNDGMHVESEDVRADYKWTFFGRIMETPRMFIFASSPRAAIYIPKRSLATPDDIKVMRRLVRENFKGTKTLRRD